MKHDWSTPFTIDVVTSVKDFVVYVDTFDGAVAFRKALKIGAVRDSALIGSWCADRRCFRFKSGNVVGNEDVGYYENDVICWTSLPKYTFYQNGVELPELNIPDAITLNI